MTASPPPAVDGLLASPAAGPSEWSWNVATGEVTWQEGIEEALFGLPRGSFAGTFEAYLSLVHPDDRNYFQAVIARTLAGEDEYVMSHRALWPDGSVHWIDGRGRLSRDADGRPLILTGIAWTATARKLAEAKLTHLSRVRAVTVAVTRELLRVGREEEAFEHACRIAVEHGHFRFAWIGLIAAGETVVRPAARAGHEDGYLDEITVTIDLSPRGRGPVGRSIRDERAVVINDTEGDDAFAPWRVPALRRGYHGCASFPLRRGGAVVGALVIYTAERNRIDADQAELLLALADDIGFKLDALDADARRRAAEEATARSEERYRALVEQAADAIFLADEGGALLEVNTAACEMTGCLREALIGRPVSELFDAIEQHEPSAPPLDDRAGIRLAGERRLRRSDGSVVDAEVTAMGLADGRVQLYARDVTQRKLVQRQLISADRMSSLGRLAAGVAHEVNNPLTYVGLNLEIVERVVAAGEVSASSLSQIAIAARDARDGADRVSEIVRSLGAFSREDEGDVQAIDLHRVLVSAVRLSENNVRQRAHIVKEYAAVRGVRGNELRLGQVFINLLVNASDALPDRTADRNEIHLHTFDEGDRVIVEVRDNGVGIPPEIIGRIFDPFFTTKPVGEGTGLGLSISHGIVSAFGGQIVVESHAGRGTTFRVSLVAESSSRDLAHARAEADKSVLGKSEVDDREPSRRASEARLRLLIVDDEEILARSLAKFFDSHLVTVATSGRAALELTRNHSYDCILCDLMMPDVSGIDLHAELVLAGRGQQRRMIFITGGAFTTRAREFIGEVENEVIEKPFSLARLKSAIVALVNREGGME